jgi:hypothetical protein
LHAQKAILLELMAANASDVTQRMIAHDAMLELVR